MLPREGFAEVDVYRAHNTPLHVAAWGLGALGFIILMHKWGFRLVSGGRYGGGR